MAAATVTARIAPSGEQMYDGQGTKITFADDPNVSIWEMETGIPGVDSGDAIDCSTHLNTAWKTKAPRTLKELMPVKVVGSYNSTGWNEILALVGVNDEITVTFPDGATIAFWGFLKSIAPGENKEGEKPTAEFEIVPTLRDASGAEQAPAFAAAP